jgi:hypothetical protein
MSFTSATMSSSRRSIWRNLSVTKSSLEDGRRMGFRLRRRGLRPRLREALPRERGRGGLRAPLRERAASVDGLFVLGPRTRAMTSCRSSRGSVITDPGSFFTDRA